MKRIRYTKFTGDLSSSFGLEDLMQALSDFLLDSGFNDPYSEFQNFNDQTLDNLRDAIKQALESGDLFDEEAQEKFDQLNADQVEDLVDQIIQKMQEQNFINAEMPEQGSGEQGEGNSQARFEVTDKSMDFLGYKALRELLGPLGKSNLGRHDTRHEASGVETNGSSKLYEFGDTLNLDLTATLSSVFAREGIRTAVEGEENTPLNIEYSDLHVQQADYTSSCATVVLLDCSHSMILYGEDRFTPAKRVAMALAHLIRTQFPGDTLNVVLFHDSAEEIPISQLSRVKVGPHYTNTREGLRLAQRILARQTKDMKQIVMITDGKPSALTLADGRIYKNAFGLDPLVIEETLQEVSRCKRSNIMINTFMLASDFALVQFVQKVSAMCRGKAYFTSPENLGNYLLMDFMSRRMKTVH
ncbi:MULTISPECIES: VWA domain-containing protein [Acidobacteriaceae]|uniref:vWA domain-containing protein n=1 Tax=Acidobacteriaceae TaxID=204434 RepID=UPI00131B72D4|nr:MULTISPECIES: VWA domain-containing protein [Acidobacteriaceae]MDW5264467.1 VWA domain-containing protein [Edaphobacter sp.]